mmetsp:Transcript_28623/g.98828  ORF Transcript_28623/g.98828 Transcript_28623/m.98828 type:complete len:377 (+) Transcript_28623:718-1848(+)
MRGHDEFRDGVARDVHVLHGHEQRRLRLLEEVSRQVDGRHVAQLVEHGRRQLLDGVVGRMQRRQVPQLRQREQAIAVDSVGADVDRPQIRQQRNCHRHRRKRVVAHVQLFQARLLQEQRMEGAEAGAPPRQRPRRRGPRKVDFREARQLGDGGRHGHQLRAVSRLDHLQTREPAHVVVDDVDARSGQPQRLYELDAAHRLLEEPVAEVAALGSVNARPQVANVRGAACVRLGHLDDGRRQQRRRGADSQQRCETRARRFAVNAKPPRYARSDSLLSLLVADHGPKAADATSPVPGKGEAARQLGTNAVAARVREHLKVQQLAKRDRREDDRHAERERVHRNDLVVADRRQLVRVPAQPEDVDDEVEARSQLLAEGA